MKSRIAFLADAESKNAILKKKIIRLCIKGGRYSIADFSREINASVPTVTKLIGELIEDGFILDLGKQGTAGGRRPSIFGLNPGAGYFIGVDIGRQHLHMGIADFSGKLINYVQDVDFVLEATTMSFRSLCAKIKDTVSNTGIAWHEVLAVGVSLSGRVNPEKGYSLTYSVSEDLPLKSFFEQELGVNVSIENDSRAMTYGEYISNPANANPNTLFINVSWGLGMGLILGGELYYGVSGFSGEIGHFPLLHNNRICRCGKIGCLETEASGSALHANLIEQIKAGRTSSLSEIYNEKGDVSLDEILKAVEDEDVLAIEGIEQIGHTLGRSIAGLINIFNPGMVIIGGRLMVGKDYLMLPIRSAINKHSLSRVSSDTVIRFSELGRRAAPFGNCMLARSKFMKLM